MEYICLAALPKWFCNLPVNVYMYLNSLFKLLICVTPGIEQYRKWWNFCNIQPCKFLMWFSNPKFWLIVSSRIFRNTYVSRYIFRRKYVRLLAATNQLQEHFSPFVHPSVRYHTIFTVIVPSWNSQKLLLLTCVMSRQKVEGRGQRSRPQRSKQILLQFGGFRTVTPVWFHRWLQNEAKISQ